MSSAHLAGAPPILAGGIPSTKCLANCPTPICCGAGHRETGGQLARRGAIMQHTEKSQQRCTSTNSESDIGEPWGSMIDELKAAARGLRGRDLQRINSRIRYLRLKCAREKGQHTNEQWEALKREFNYRCVRCGFGIPGEDVMFKDHIVPIYQGGSDGIENIQPLCGRCNCSKSSETTNWVDIRRMNGGF